MDYKAEQEMELEALEAILMDDLTGPTSQRDNMHQSSRRLLSSLTSCRMRCRVGGGLARRLVT